MDNDKFQELLDAKALAEQELEKMRTPVTILFSDIKDSTRYFEKNGDVAGMAMVQRHNDLLFPVIQTTGGRVVKTIGDAIMACFNEPADAVKAAVGMQRALSAMNQGYPAEEQIHIKIGVHTGLGLLKDNDVFGDVVNAAARVQHQAKPGQILITDVLLEAAKASGIQCANFGKAEMKGKDEQIDVYAVAWSDLATEQIVEEIQKRFELKVKEGKRLLQDVEEEFENSRDQWRAERRKLSAEIEQLEESMERARSVAKAQLSDDLQSELRFQLEESLRVRRDVEQQAAAAQAKWNEERAGLKAQIASMQASVIEAMERSNNPSRLALAIREQVDSRLTDAKQEWLMQWESERRRLTAEIERFKKSGGVAEEKKEAAKRALLERMGKLPPGSSPGTKSAGQWQKEFEDAKIQWEGERDQLTLRVRHLENEVQHGQDAARADVFQELRGQYEPKLAAANRDLQRMEGELKALRSQSSDERERLEARIAELEAAIPEAQASARRQLGAELQEKFDARLEESTRLRSRAERKLQDVTEELDAERRRTKRQLAQLEEQLKEARETAYKAQRLKS